MKEPSLMANPYVFVLLELLNIHRIVTPLFWFEMPLWIKMLSLSRKFKFVVQNPFNI